MSVLSPLTEWGLTATVTETGNLKIKGLSSLSGDQARMALEYARKHKPEILLVLTQADSLAQCESCPAAGYWDFKDYARQGLLCFHYAYYQGRSGKPKPCTEMRTECLRGKTTLK